MQATAAGSLLMFFHLTFIAVTRCDLCVCVTGVQRREDQQRDPLQATAPLQQR